MELNIMMCLDIAQRYAESYSGCEKVKVGSVIVKDGKIVSLGANRTILYDCLKLGCLRKKKYGENNKEHRNSGDCSSIHSEIDAIAKSSSSLEGATIYVTRYPCEECTKAIISAGIKKVYYGRAQSISKVTKSIFDRAHIEIVHIGEWCADDAWY